MIWDASPVALSSPGIQDPVAVQQVDLDHVGPHSNVPNFKKIISKAGFQFNFSVF